MERSGQSPEMSERKDGLGDWLDGAGGKVKDAFVWV